MKALVLSMAASVSESAFARLWRKLGDIFEVVIPLALFATVVIVSGALAFGFVH